MLTELQTKIITYVSENHGLDGIDIATHFHLPIDTIYREIAILLDNGFLKKEYIGVGSVLSVAHPTASNV